MYRFYENIDIFKKRFHLYFSQYCQGGGQYKKYPETRSQNFCVVNVGMKD